MKIKNRNFLTNYLAITIFITNITQIPQMISMGFNSILTLMCWIMNLFFLMMDKKFCLRKKLLNIILLCMIFLVYILSLQIVVGKNYISSSIVYPFLLSTFVFSIGFLLAPYIKKSDYKFLFYSYIISGIIVAIAVYMESFTNGFSWNSIGYAYSSKNSVSQIILTVVILLSFTEFSQKKIISFLRVIIVILLIYLLMMLKSRASILGIGIIILVILFNKNIKKVHKYALLTGVVIFIITLFVNKDFYDIFVNNIILANRDVASLNSISSGRMDMYKLFPKLYMEAPLIGRGIYYTESFPLSILLQYGALGSLLIITFLMIPIKVLLKIKQDKITLILWIILACYYINGFFEELSPLGPGVKCYMLWLLFGLIYGREKINTRDDKKKS